MRVPFLRMVACAAIALQLLGAMVLSGDALAQSSTAVTDGTAFAKSVAPTSGKQIVNPTGVNASAWSGSTTTPTAVPSTLGKFSTPNVSTDNYTAAKAIGLAGFGNQAVMNCSTYDPATGDPTQTQTCAAVNFLSNRCLSPTTAQGAVMAANATAATPMASDCTGTYGQAQAEFGYSEGESSSDAIFGVIKGLPSTASAATGETCTTQTVVVTPAQYAINTCTKDDSATEYTCYQYLNTSVQTTYTTPTTTQSCTSPAVLQNGYCVSSTSSPAPVVYGCPPGDTLEGSTCVSSTSTPANPTYSCPPGYTLSGSTCSQTSTTPGSPSTTCATVPATERNPSKISGYYPGTYDGHTGYCRYYFINASGTETPLQKCQSHVTPYLTGGSSLFDASQVNIVTGRDSIELSCFATPEAGCPTGYTWNGSVCQELVTQSATIIGYSCPTGVVTGDQCVVTTSNPADPSYQCPDGTVLSGSTCVSSTSNPPNVTYSCPDGSAPVSGECITNYVLTSWVDTCGPYEASSGTTLPTPP